MASSGFEPLIKLINDGSIKMDSLITRKVKLSQVHESMLQFRTKSESGITIINNFSMWWFAFGIYLLLIIICRWFLKSGDSYSTFFKRIFNFFSYFYGIGCITMKAHCINFSFYFFVLLSGDNDNVQNAQWHNQLIFNTLCAGGGRRQHVQIQQHPL